MCGEQTDAIGAAAAVVRVRVSVVYIGYCGYSEPFGGPGRAIQASVWASQVPTIPRYSRVGKGLMTSQV